ncbi:hypothetical protein ACFFF7_00165 [Novosphingobium aquiterrae]|uniref:DUF1570 domain-containing protein n=1 Tax=Novosphingobium aquiterrae TaxID=624388 RepID=A0ABV6PDB6_9SPHN
MSFRKLLSASLAAVSLAGLAAPAQAEWIEAKSKHFTVYGDMKPDDLKARTLELEKFDAVLRGLFNVQTDDMATIYYVATMGDVEKLYGRQGVGGFYNATAQGALGVIPERLPNMPNFAVGTFTPERIMFHEYTHHMLLSNSGKYFPAWATEGLAELFMSVRFDDKGNAIVGGPNTNRLFDIGAASRWSVAQLLGNGMVRPKGDDGIELYSRGWALCHYLLISGKRPGQFFKYIDAINAGDDPLKAGKQVFGDLDQLDKEIERYIRASKFPSSLIPVDKIKTPLDVAVRNLSPSEGAMLPFRLQSAVGVNDKTARPLALRARPIATTFANDPFVQRAMAEMEYDAKDYDAADAAADRALAADPKNVMAMVYKGRVAVQRALAKNNDPALLKEGRRWFLAANKLAPDFAQPFQSYYDSFVVVGQVPPAGADTGINRAVYLVPSDESLRARAVMSALRAGDIKLAKFILAPLAYAPHGATDNPFTKLMAAITAGGDKAALLAKAKELKIDQMNEFKPVDFTKKDDAKKVEGDKPKA